MKNYKNDNVDFHQKKYERLRKRNFSYGKIAGDLQAILNFNFKKILKYLAKMHWFSHFQTPANAETIKKNLKHPWNFLY